ncbi:MAG: 5'/3'-nucleotidase SurE [Clostridia bacterium]|nr:5'/3'-nucleotidase SurE [Clostridia bacterium]
MRICITNDDGIHAKGLCVLARWAGKVGDVTIVAPRYQQSGKSHSIDIHQPYAVERAAHETGFAAWQVDSTPADCVRVAMMALGEKFDLVLSGINHGYNLGREITYSGTVGAALEAGVQGTKAIALSTRREIFDGMEEKLDNMWAFFQEKGLLQLADVWNVNIPEEYTGRIVLARQGGPFYSDTFFMNGGLASVEGKPVWQPGGDANVDTDAVLQFGHISVTPLTNDRTNEKVLSLCK